MITFDTLYDKYSTSNIPLVSEIDKEGNITSYKYKDILERALLLEEKFKKYLNGNDRCIICSKDNVNITVYYLLLFKLNAVAVLVDKNTTRKELKEIISKVKPTVIMTDDEHENMFNNLSHIYINMESDKLSVNKDIPKVKKENDVARTIIFSSGTTSKKSGIVHKTSNIYEMIKYTNERYKCTSKDKFITIVPYSHIYGLAINVIFNTYIGTNIYYLDGFDLKVIYKVLKDVRFDYFCGVTKFYEMLAEGLKDKMGKYKYTAKIFYFIRKNFGINLGKKVYKEIFDVFHDVCCISAGAFLETYTERFLYGLGFPIIEFYGSTETNVPIVTTVDKNKYTHGIGKVLAPSVIKIKPGTNELLVRNDYMIDSYVEEDRHIEDLMDEEGYINTGDMARVNKKGVYIIGRTKEVIVLPTGEKYSPTDIESYYEELDVKDFSICGVPLKKDSKCDKIHMFVVKKDNQEEKDVLKEINRISKELNTNVKIRDIHFIKEIPRTAIGKPRRYIMKKMVEEGKVK